ncbi:MAG: hypothetical protein LAO31_19780 [Acidobacteriia bacterium]|nr:hypothetical protein [Terriglobia bacterium]
MRERQREIRRRRHRRVKRIKQHTKALREQYAKPAPVATPTAAAASVE